MNPTGELEPGSGSAAGAQGENGRYGAGVTSFTLRPQLIGIGAIVLSGAHVGRGSVIGAGAVVREGERIEPFSLIVGVPGRLVRTLPLDTYDSHCQWAQKYLGLARAHRGA